MLWQRVLTSFALLGLILGAVLALSETLFSIFILIVMCIAVWEWSSLAGLNSTFTRMLYVSALLIIMLISTLDVVPVSILFYIAAAFWLIALTLIYLFPRAQFAWGKKPILALTGVVLFIPGWLAFYTLRSQEFHQFHILLLFFLVAAADIGAYFSGRTFGKHKLAVKVSPNKTWEGFFGGGLACVFLILVTAYMFADYLPDLDSSVLIKLILSAVVIAAFSVIGDLFESMVKRFRDVKDSGSILPGHGGILDRIDGLTAAAPMYAILLIQLGPDLL